jgi:F-type H+-transporting ATPase subunit b
MNINLTLIGQTISFALFVLFCLKFVWPPIMAALTERKQKIADGLAAADRGVREQELAEKKAAMVIKDSHEKASEIVSNANTRGNELIEQAKHQAQEEADRIREKGKADVEKELLAAREQLRAEVATLTLSGVKQILGREVRADDHADILSGLAAKL